MCGRYKLEEHWQEYCQAAYFNWQDPPWPTPNPLKGSEEARPTDPMPIIRRNEQGHLFPELRRWGFIIMVDGKTIDKTTGQPKKIKRDVINAMSEKLTSSYMVEVVVQGTTLPDPNVELGEWPEAGASKQRVRVSMPSERVFMAAGLFDDNVSRQARRFRFTPSAPCRRMSFLVLSLIARRWCCYRSSTTHG